jgi:hypothetical protein
MGEKKKAGHYSGRFENENNNNMARIAELGMGESHHNWVQALKREA